MKKSLYFAKTCFLLCLSPIFLTAQFTNVYNHSLGQGHLVTATNVWQADHFGLVKYDLNGNVLQIFDPTNSPIPTTGGNAADGRCLELAADGQGNIWIAMGQYGIARLTPSGQWTQWNSNNTPVLQGFYEKIAAQKNGTVWVGGYSGTLCKFENGNWTQEFVEGNPVGQLYDIITDSNDQPVFSRFDAIYRKEASGWVNLYDGPDLKINDLFAGENGRIYWAAQLGYFGSIPADPGAPSIVDIPWKTTPDLYTIAVRNGHWYLGGWYDAGIWHWDGNTWSQMYLEPSTITNEIVRDLSFDASGNLWVTQAPFASNGLQRFDGTNWKVFYAGIPVGKVADADHSGNYWFANDGFLTQYNPKNKNTQYFTWQNGKFPYLRVTGLSVGINETVWIAGVEQNLKTPFPAEIKTLMQWQGGVVQTKYTAQNTNNGLPSGDIYALEADKTGRVFLAVNTSGYDYGLTVFNSNDQTWETLHRGTTAANQRLPINKISDISTEKSGQNTWIANGTGGLLQYRSATRDFAFFTKKEIPNLPDNIKQVAADDATVWFLSERGIGKITNANPGSFTEILPSASGLASLDILDMKTDNKGDLWLTERLPGDQYLIQHWDGNRWENFRESDSHFISPNPGGPYDDYGNRWIITAGSDDQVFFTNNTGISAKNTGTSTTSPITISCSPDYTINALDNGGICGNITPIPLPVATTTCAQGGVTVTFQSYTVLSGNPIVKDNTGGSNCAGVYIQGEGTAQVVFKATDACGNTEICSFNITRNILQSSVVFNNCPQSVAVTASPGANSMVVNYPALTASVTNCPNAASVGLVSPSGTASGSVFPVGATTVAWKAYLPGGCGYAEATCTFDVIVRPFDPNNNLPDLVPIASLTTAAAANGQTVYMRGFVKNKGTEPTANNFKYKILQSEDNILDAGDVLIYTISHTNFMAAGDSVSLAELHIPIPLSNDFSGTRYYIVQIDADNEVVESTDANNTLVLALKITAPAPQNCKSDLGTGSILCTQQTGEDVKICALSERAIQQHIVDGKTGQPRLVVWMWPWAFDSTFIRGKQIQHKSAAGTVTFQKDIPQSILNILPNPQAALLLPSGEVVLAGFVRQPTDSINPKPAKTRLIVLRTTNDLTLIGAPIAADSSFNYNPYAGFPDRVYSIIPLSGNRISLLYTTSYVSFVTNVGTGLRQFTTTLDPLNVLYLPYEAPASWIKTPCGTLRMVTNIRNVDQKGHFSGTVTRQLDIDHANGPRILSALQTGAGSSDYYGAYVRHSYQGMQPDTLNSGYSYRPTADQPPVFEFQWSPADSVVLPNFLPYTDVQRTAGNKVMLFGYLNGQLWAHLPGCEGVSSVENTVQDADFQLFPNPAGASVVLSLQQTVAFDNGFIINQSGQVVQAFTFENARNNSITLDVSNLDNGVYFVQIQTKGGDRLKRKLVVVR